MKSLCPTSRVSYREKETKTGEMPSSSYFFRDMQLSFWVRCYADVGFCEMRVKSQLRALCPFLTPCFPADTISQDANYDWLKTIALMLSHLVLMI